MIRLLSNVVRLGLLTLFLLSDCLIGTSATAAQLTLNWTDNSNNEDGFKIERRESGSSTFGQIATVNANVTSYADGSVTSGTTYCYQVRAYNTAGNSGYAGPACGTATQSTTYLLTITKAGSGSGTVSSTPAGITCGSNCSEAYAANTVVTLSATPSAGSTFAGWSGDSACSDGVVTLSTNRACAATFNLLSQNMVLSFTLINADTDRPIASFDPLQNGALLNFATLPTRNLNIRANTNPAIVGSVHFNLDNGTTTRTENGTPYALASNNNDDYDAWTPSLGLHTLTAVAYTESNLGGTAGPPLTLSFTVVNQSTPPLGLVAAYGFGEGSGTTVADASEDGNTGTLVGATWVNGKYGKALNFTGGSSVQVNSTALHNRVPFTYCAWVYPRSQGGQKDGRILHKGTNSARKQFQTDSSVVDSLALHVDRASGAAQAVSTANALTLNQWQFVCGTYSEAGGPRVYRNGVEVAYSSRTVGAGATTGDAGDKLFIGNRGTDDKGWDGLIDEVWIYNRVLTSSEMQTAMANPVSAASSSQSVAQTVTAPDDGDRAMKGGRSSSLCGTTCTAARHSNPGAAAATKIQLAEKIGVFRPSTSRWYLDVNGNGVLDDCSIGGCLPLGQPDDPPVVGDWAGGSGAKLGVFDSTTGQGTLDLNRSSKLDSCTEDDCVGSFGLSGDFLVVGDWSGTGQEQIGVFDPETGIWELDLNDNGTFDGCEIDICLGPFGRQGDIPIVGKW